MIQTQGFGSPEGGVNETTHLSQSSGCAFQWEIWTLLRTCKVQWLAKNLGKVYIQIWLSLLLITPLLDLSPYSPQPSQSLASALTWEGPHEKS